MTEHQVGELLLDLALLFTLTYLLAGLLERRRIPGILAALFISMAVRYIPLGGSLLSSEFHASLSFLADLGVLFLLFFIGLQIDLKEMQNQSGDIIWLTALNTIVPFLLGMAAMLALGYGWLLAFIIGLTRMPTAEAVIVGIGLDARLITEIIVAQLPFNAGLIDVRLFTALVAAASFTAITVPLGFSLLIRRWGEQLTTPQSDIQPKEDSLAG